jgi:hypothetical protein
MSKVAIQGNASGSGLLTIAAPNTNTDRTLTLPDGTGTFTVNGVNSNIVSGTAVASTSGTSIDFTGIPSWVKRITVMFNGVSTNGSSVVVVRLGTSGGVQATSYTGSSIVIIDPNTVGSAALSTGFDVNYGAAVALIYGSAVINLSNTNTWVASYSGSNKSNVALIMSGSVALSSTLDRVRITTVNGTDTFDAGSINILYE